MKQAKELQELMESLQKFQQQIGEMPNQKTFTKEDRDLLDSMRRLSSNETLPHIYSPEFLRET